MKLFNEELNLKWVTRSGVIMFLDVICIMSSYLMALLLRFDFEFSNIPEKYILGYAASMIFWVAATIVVYYGLRLYHSIWTFASISELQRIVTAYTVLIFVYGAGILIMGLRMPRSYYFMGYVLSFCLCAGIRFSYRYLRYLSRSHERSSIMDPEERIMIIGGGQAGQIILRELRNNDKASTTTAVTAKVCCIIDDNKSKTGRILEGVPIVGGREAIPEAVKAYDINRIIFAIPTATSESKRAILNICKETNCRLQTLPGIYQLVNGEVSTRALKDVDIVDLLGRDEININNEEVYKMIAGKTALVTGGGGSIGSELCRQIADNNPKQLIIFDIYENSVYDVQQSLKKIYPNMDLKVLIGSVRDEERINSVMQKYRPDVVFHAAAHKHVPLMEDSPCEAVKNNALGTYKTAEAAADAGVKKFILISTDKAVNPTVGQ